MNQNKTTPSLDEIKALDGRIFKMLTEQEEEVFNFYRDRGRKYGLSVGVRNEASAELLATASSQEQADQILKSANSRIFVTVMSQSESKS